MPPEGTDRAYLWDMLDAAKAVQQFVAGRTFHDYVNDRMLRGAVERHLEIIGEAARKVSSMFRDLHPDIPWRSIIAQRHVLAHEYGEIKQELIWAAATIHIAKLTALLEPLVPCAENEP